MPNDASLEIWLTGPVTGIPALLQPVAHGLLQCQREVRATLGGLATEQIWQTPSGLASVGFHARHAAGSLDRLLTYARGDHLSPAQLALLAGEGARARGPSHPDELIAAFDEAIERALLQVRATDESSLLDARFVGRAQLPSTVIGLLVHAAEHTQRHAGQMVTTANLVRATRK